METNDNRLPHLHKCRVTTRSSLTDRRTGGQIEGEKKGIINNNKKKFVSYTVRLCYDTNLKGGNNNKNRCVVVHRCLDVSFSSAAVDP